MGKDDKRASQKASGGMSKDDLKVEHTKLVKREKELDNQYQEVRAIFQKLEETYQSSKGTFSVSRYGQLKNMIKGATSETTMRNIQQITQETPAGGGGSGGKAGLASLMSKAKEFSGEAQQEQAKEEATASGKNPGRLSSFMKKLKNATGFSDEPITAEDVMSESDLQRDNGRKQRAIQHHINQLNKALTKLQKLKHDYEASKAHGPPKRYQELKDMIKIATADKFT